MELTVSFVVAALLGGIVVGVLGLLLFFRKESSAGEADTGESLQKRQDYTEALGGEHSDAMVYFTLQYVDPDQEDEYLRFYADQFCQSYVGACLATVLYSIHQLFRGFWDKGAPLLGLLRDRGAQASPPAILYCGFWLSCLITAVLIFALSRLPSFRKSRYPEMVLVSCGLFGSGLMIIAGNEWRVSRAFKMDPEKVFGVISGDDRLILSAILIQVYFASFTPVRHARQMLLALAVGVVYSASSFIYGVPPEDGRKSAGQPEEGHNYAECAWFVMVLAFVAMGHRCVEKVRRVSFLTVLHKFEAQRKERVQLY